MATGFVVDKVHYFRSLLYDGIDHSIPGNGGIECYNFLSANQRVADTVSYLMVLFFGLVPIAVRKLRTSKESAVDYNRSGSTEGGRHYGKRVLLFAICLTFGIEIGYKLSTKQLLYLLNPCHILTTLQVNATLNELEKASARYFLKTLRLLQIQKLTSAIPFFAVCLDLDQV